MKPRSARLPAVMAALVLASGCASSSSSSSSGGGSWIPDFSSWFSSENQVLVSEVVNDSQCNAPDANTTIQVLKNADGVAAWQTGRGINLLGITELPDSLYVAVDLGQRKSAGHGLAVSRQAGLKNDVLVLKATTFMPRSTDATAEVMTSPCALVRLPEVKFESLRLINQTGKVLASTAAGAPRP
jgi:hypothetical protein